MNAQLAGPGGPDTQRVPDPLPVLTPAILLRDELPDDDPELQNAACSYWRNRLPHRPGKVLLIRTSLEQQAAA